jgi:4-hydroxyphenylpyruvate dioxygenase
MANTMGITGYDFVEFYVGSAKMVTYWFVKAMGMDITGYMGPETGVRDRGSYYLTQNGLKFVITSALKPSNSDVTSFVTNHGDGVKRWAMKVEDVQKAFEKAVKNGAIPTTLPHKLEDEKGFIEEAGIKLYDDTELVFINDSKYKGIFRPGFVANPGGFEIRREQPGLLKIDHIVGNARVNEMEQWAEYFIKTMDFEEMLYFGPGDISTKYSALLSKVVRTSDYTIRNPINEPYEGLKMSQIEEYINEYNGTGTQHIAIATDDIISSVRSLRENGMEFLDIPGNYYDELEKKNAALKGDERITEDLDQIRELGILVDMESTGYLLQLFTRPTGDRPTFFFEVIQRRRGAKGFGHGNFQALFESIEREQARRGNL